MKLWKFFNVSVTTVKSQCAWWDALHDTQEQRLLHCPVWRNTCGDFTSRFIDNGSSFASPPAVLQHESGEFFSCYILVYQKLKPVMQCTDMLSKLCVHCTCTIIRNMEWQGLHHIPSSWAFYEYDRQRRQIADQFLCGGSLQILTLSSLKPDVVRSRISVGLNFGHLFGHARPYRVSSCILIVLLPCWSGSRCNLQKNIKKRLWIKITNVLACWSAFARPKTASDYPENLKPAATHMKSDLDWKDIITSKCKSTWWSKAILKNLQMEKWLVVQFLWLSKYVCQSQRRITFSSTKRDQTTGAKCQFLVKPFRRRTLWMAAKVVVWQSLFSSVGSWPWAPGHVGSLQYCGGFLNSNTLSRYSWTNGPSCRH